MTGIDARRSRIRRHEACHGMVVSHFATDGLELETMWTEVGGGGGLRFLRPTVETPESRFAELVATVAGPEGTNMAYGTRDGEGSDECEESDRASARRLAQRLSEGSLSYFVQLNTAELEAQRLVSRYYTEIEKLAQSLEYAGDRLAGQDLVDAVSRARAGRHWFRLAPPAPAVRRVVGRPTDAQLAEARRSSGSELVFTKTPTGYRSHRARATLDRRPGREAAIDRRPAREKGTLQRRTGSEL